MNRVLLNAAASLLVLQFLFSGVIKIFKTRTCSDAALMERVFGDRCALNMTVLILAGIWEVVASLGVIVPTVANRFSHVRRVCLYSLAVFTALATAMFKLRPLKYYGLMANLSTIGGLLLAFQ
tara:strand:- start:2715 stop:3083 length:369 start_codon:yes stop_codon:yes gene_type:complete